MHHIYHTEGIILGSKNFGEAGKYYYIFTRDLGMISASAQGVRKMSSKLRFVLQDFAYLKVDFVRGKDFWRVTSATKGNKLEKITRQPETFAIYKNISYLLKRLLQGEDANAALFTELLNGLIILEKSSSADELRNIEAVLVLRILSNLGYIGESEALSKLIKSPFEEGLVFEAAKQRMEVLNHINKALKETHL
jgi:DNA repair protein RecO